MIWILLLLLFVAFLFLAGDFFSRFTAGDMTENPDFVMTCSKPYFLSVLAADTLFLAAAVWSVESAANPPIILPIILLLLCMWLSYELAWTLVVRVEVKDDMLQHRSVMGGTNRLQVNRIMHVEYLPKVRWFAVRLDDGTTMRVSRVMTSLPDFAAWISSRVKESRIEKETRTILDSTANGSLPGIWL